jgi:hypothetical protein
MEFQITKNAKNLIYGLIGTGLVLTGIGLATGMGDDHFSTRLLTNGIIN